jgi:predicted XRE-type DNA-binding protein
VFVNKNKDFVTVADRTGLDYLLGLMSDHARATAEEKIGLSAKIAELGQAQFALPVSGNEKPPLMQAGQLDGSADAVTNAAQTENMKLRSELMSALKHYIHRAHLSQSQAATVFGVTQPRISDLTRGKVDLFGLDALVNMAATAGLHVELRILETA